MVLSVPQQMRVRDSIATLKSLRVSIKRERRAWHGAASAYNAALDSLTAADQASQAEARHLKEVVVSGQVLLVSQTHKTDKYRARAHRKGLVNAVLSAAVLGLLYLVASK